MYKVFRFKSGQVLTVTTAEKELLDFLKEYLPKESFNLYAKMKGIRDIVQDVLKNHEQGYFDRLRWSAKRRQQLKMLLLPFKKQQERVRIHIHMQSCDQYSQYLKAEVNREIDKPDNQRLIFDVYNVLYQLRPYPHNVLHASPKMPLFPTVKKELIQLYSSKNLDELRALKLRKIEPLLQANPNLLMALKKHVVVNEAKLILNNPTNATHQVLNRFRIHLVSHKPTLLQRRDSGLINFLKNLGVSIASLFGIGVGGYFAYQGLFGDESTKGGQFLKEVEANENTIYFGT